MTIYCSCGSVPLLLNVRNRRSLHLAINPLRKSHCECMLTMCQSALCLWQQWSCAYRNIPISPSQLTDGITVAMGAASSDMVHVPLYFTRGSRSPKPGLFGESLPAVPHPKQRDHSTVFSLVCKSKPQQTQIFADSISRTSRCSGT